VESTLPNGIATVLFANPPAVGEPAYCVGMVGLLRRSLYEPLVATVARLAIVAYFANSVLRKVVVTYPLKSIDVSPILTHPLE